MGAVYENSYIASQTFSYTNESFVSCSYVFEYMETCNDLCSYTFIVQTIFTWSYQLYTVNNCGSTVMFTNIITKKQSAFNVVQWNTFPCGLSHDSLKDSYVAI